MSKKTRAPKIETEFRRLDRKMGELAALILRRFDEIIASTSDDIAPQTAVDFLASSLMERDEQVFDWLLQSQAAHKLYERADAKMNLHELNETMH